MAAVIFSGNNVKALKPNLDLFGSVSILSGAVDPTMTSTLAPKGSLYLSTSTGLTYRKLDAGSSTNWAINSSVVSNDIPDTSFSASNNVSSPANVTGLVFNNANVRSAQILLSVTVIATTNLYQFFTLNVIQNATGWYLGGTSVGDTSGFVFSITSAGQLQYLSSNNSGFVSGTIHFSAKTLGV